MIKQRPSKRKKIVLIILVLLLVSAASLLVLEKKGITNLYTKTNNGASEEKTTSNTTTAQEDFNDGEIREPGNTSDENRGSGGITDGNGSIGNVDTSNPVVSSTGEITLYNPKPNELIGSGHQLAGASSLSKVSYRIIDEVSGVISMGEISVVNGKFSGSISFSTSADRGRLDLYGTRSDGVEFSNIEVPLRFKQ